MDLTYGNRTSFGYQNRGAKIYGVSWDKSSNTELTRLGASIGMVANVGVDAQVVQNDFDSAQIYKEMVEVVDLYGNQFIRIPKFYIRKVDQANLKTWEISKKPFTGCYLPWCFWDFTNNKSLPYIDVGKYKAGQDGSNRLTSKTGEYPLVNTNIVSFRTKAQANGVGYQLLDIHLQDVLETLFLVEFATLNSQSKMSGYTTGQYSATQTAVIAESGVNRIVLTNANASGYVVGQTIGIGTTLGGQQIASNRQITAINTYDASNKSIVFDGSAVNIAIGNILYNTGQKNGDTDSVVAKSGSRISNSDGKRPCKYRGIESPWGDVWQWMDGININNNQSWICENPSSYASNVFAFPYKQIGYVNKNADGWVKSRGFDSNYPFCEICVDNTGASNQYYSDYYYQNTGQRVAHVGGYWNVDSHAGLFFRALALGSSDSYLVVGSRLLKKPL